METPHPSVSWPGIPVPFLMETAKAEYNPIPSIALLQFEYSTEELGEVSLTTFNKPPVRLPRFARNDRRQWLAITEEMAD